MGFSLTTDDYVDYLNKAYLKIHENGDYITKLDAATGDGDHWANLNMGFEKLLEISDELKALNLSDCFKKIGMTMMSVIGGSSGVLYGSAYIEAAKIMKDVNALTNQTLCNVLEAMLHGIMNRGKSEPGQKTMIDALYPAVIAYKECIAKDKSETETLTAVKQAAKKGAENTKEMEALRGRAYYQSNKGVGHLDPGAVTLAYQIEALMDFVCDKL